MVVNNLTSGNSVSSNCEQDDSIPLLNDFHEFLLEYKDKEPANSKNYESAEHDNDIILFEPEFSNVDLNDVEVVGCNIVEEEALSRVCSIICQKILETTSCPNCINNLQTAVASISQELISIEGDSDNFHKRPSDIFMKNFKTLFCAINEIIPNVCSDHFIKQKIHSQINIYNIDTVGCSEHNAEIITKLKLHTVDYSVMSFCNNINSMLAGKITALPSNSNKIQELAIEFKKKGKHIGRYSDIFET